MNLPQKLAAHPRFRWMPRMQANSPTGPVTVLNVHAGTVYHDKGAFNEGDPGYTPDLDDAATVGTIEAQVRAISPFLYVTPPLDQAGHWIVQDIERDVAFGKTLGEAWGRAFLEVAK